MRVRKIEVKTYEPIYYPCDNQSAKQMEVLFNCFMMTERQYRALIEIGTPIEIISD